MENKTGLWEKKSQKGLIYYNGKIKIEGKEYYISLFKNENKEKETAPDYNIILREKEEKKEEAKEKENVYAKFGEINSISDEEIAF